MIQRWSCAVLIVNLRNEVRDMTLKSKRDLIVSNRRKTVYLKRETPATPPEELIVYLLSIKWSKSKMVQNWSKERSKNW